MRKLLLGTAILLGGTAALAGLQASRAQVAPTNSAAAAGVALKPDDVIAARQGGFDMMGGIVDAMQGAVAAGGDVKPLEGGAKSIANWGHVIPTLFPVGTEKGHNTKARAEIWSDGAGFEKAANALSEAATKLASSAAANDKAAFAADLKTMGGTCGGCHRNFRAR